MSADVIPVSVTSITVYAKVGNKKRKLWSVKTDDEIEFSKEILEDLLSGDEKVRVKLESLNLPF